MNVRPKGLILFVLLCVCLIMMAQQQAEASEKRMGLVVSLKGDVTVRRANASLTVKEGFVLQPGDTMRIGAGAHCGGFTPGGGRFDQGGPHLIVFAGIEKGKRDSRSEWITEQVQSLVSEPRSRQLVTRTGRDWKVQNGMPRLMIPAPDARVRASRANFYWSTIDGVDRYEMTIVGEEGDEVKKIVRGHKIEYSDLQAGYTYSWKIQPVLEGLTSSSGWRSFNVMTSKEEERLEEALTGVPDLEAGVLLLSMGLHGEAVYRFDAAAARTEARCSALRWRAQTFAAIGLYRDAFTDLLSAME